MPAQKLQGMKKKDEGNQSPPKKGTGPYAAFLGAIVGKTLTGGGVGLFFTPLSIIYSFMAASMKRHTLLRLRGWMFSAVLLSCLIAGWYATPIGREAPLYPIPHLIGLGMILLLRDKVTGYLNCREKGMATESTTTS